MTLWYQGFEKLFWFLLYTVRSSKRLTVSSIRLCKNQFDSLFSFSFSFAVSLRSTTVKRINTQSIFVKHYKKSVHHTSNYTQAKDGWKGSQHMESGGRNPVIVLSRNNVVKRNIISETDRGVCYEPSIDRINKCPFFDNNLHSSTQRKESGHYSKCQNGAFYLNVSRILSFKDFSLKTSYHACQEC